MSSKEKELENAEKLAKAGKFDKAIKELEKIAVTDRADMRVRLKIGDLYAKKKEIKEAVKHYREVADFYTKENFHLKAIAVCKNILKLNPLLIEVNEQLGNLYHEVGIDQDAMHQYYIVAGHYDNKGMSKEALAIRKKIMEIDPENTAGRIRMAELMQSTGDEEKSLEEYEKVAKSLKKKNDQDGLIEVYEKLLHYKPENVEMLTELCHIYFSKRDFKKALARIEKAPAAIRDVNLDLMELQCEALLEDHQIDKARRQFRDLYEKALQTRQAEKAAKIYSRILQEFSDDLDYLKELAEIQKETGVTHKETKAKFRQDFESTEMIDLNKLDELKKKR